MTQVFGKLSNALLSFIFALTLSTAWGQVDTLKVLFIGNSYTYYHNLPQLVQNISDSCKIKIVSRQSTAGGANLSDHWNGDKNLQTREIIAEGGFDLVILQDHSMGPILNPDRFHKYADLFCDLIKESGAKPYFYLTWARKKVPQYEKVLNREYHKAATRNDVQVIPIGLAWAQALKTRPGVEIYSHDGSHPSELGTYLTACVVAGALTGSLPQYFPPYYTIKDKFGEPVKLLHLDSLDLKFCQETARHTIHSYSSSP